MGRSSAPRLIGVGVDGTTAGRDAIELGSLLARPTAAELMLIAVPKEPLIQLAAPGGFGWAALKNRAWSTLAETRDALAPEAWIVVHPDVLVWRGLRHVVHVEHRDLFVVGCVADAPDGRVRLGRSARELLAHLDCPLAVAPAECIAGSCRVWSASASDSTVSRSRVRRWLWPVRSSSWPAPSCRFAGSQGGWRPAFSAGYGSRTSRSTEDNVARQLTSLLASELTAAEATGVVIEVDVTPGTPVDALNALRDRVDLFVVGSAHSAPQGRVQVGGTFRAVLRDARCLVLIVPPRA